MHSQDPTTQQSGYLFATFKSGAMPISEQVYFGLSENGRDWSALNNAEPILISSVGEQGARDPFLVRSPDGSKCYLIATDLSTYYYPDWNRAVREGSRSILIWESNDLVNWKGPRLVEIATPDAGCTWAPEAIWDEKSTQFLMFWASTTARDEFAKQRIWAAWTTDFETFTEPFLWIDNPHHVIDTDVVRDGEKYFRFSKDEQTKAITLERADNLLSEWQIVSSFSLAHLEGVEGPLCFRLGDGTWYLLLDFFATGQGYKAFQTSDLASGQFSIVPDVSFPFKFRHGGVLSISGDELSRLKAHFSTTISELITS